MRSLAPVPILMAVSPSQPVTIALVMTTKRLDKPLFYTILAEKIVEIIRKPGGYSSDLSPIPFASLHSLQVTSAIEGFGWEPSTPVDPIYPSIASGDITVDCTPV
jgi:hypothetical protein